MVSYGGTERCLVVRICFGWLGFTCAMLSSPLCESRGCRAACLILIPSKLHVMHLRNPSFFHRLPLRVCTHRLLVTRCLSPQQSGSADSAVVEPQQQEEGNDDVTNRAPRRTTIERVGGKGVSRGSGSGGDAKATPPDGGASLWEGLGSWEGLGEGLSGVRQRWRERGGETDTGTRKTQDTKHGERRSKEKRRTLRIKP